MAGWNSKRKIHQLDAVQCCRQCTIRLLCQCFYFFNFLHGLHYFDGCDERVCVCVCVTQSEERSVGWCKKNKIKIQHKNARNLKKEEAMFSLYTLCRRKKFSKKLNSISINGWPCWVSRLVFFCFPFETRKQRLVIFNMQIFLYIPDERALLHWRNAVRTMTFRGGANCLMTNDNNSAIMRNTHALILFLF